MKKAIFILSAAAVLLLMSCAPPPGGGKGTEIISAQQALTLLKSGNVVLVDADTGVNYKKRHVEGAVNIPRPAIVVNNPVPNMLAPADQIERVLSAAGIGNDTLILAYDDNKNMDSARLWFTVKVYGHDKVKVVSGGFTALTEAGAAVTSAIPEVAPASFSAGPLREDMLISGKEIRKRVENPPGKYVLIDTRSLQEYNEGTIPGALQLDFSGNNFSDGTYKPVNQIRIRYLEEKIDYDDEIDMFCKTSIRGAQTYLALYNAGYRNLKLYDGAWVEWVSNPMNPVFIPEGAALKLDASDQS